ncbi:MAG: SRPBCC domain-containing protein [Burkholderiaceae bacterium]
MSSRVMVAIRVAATPAHAFEVFTREIYAWWRATPLFAFARGSPGVLAFEPHLGGRFIETGDEGTQFEIGRIVDWSPPARLAFTWRQASFTAGQETEVEVRFDAIGDETRVTVEHRGWDSVPQDHVARHTFPNAIFLQRHGLWWQVLLDSFQKRATNRESCHGR